MDICAGGVKGFASVEVWGKLCFPDVVQVFGVVGVDVCGDKDVGFFEKGCSGEGGRS